MPALTAQGVTDKEGIAEHIGRFLTNQYAAQLGVIFATQQARIEKDLNIEKGSKGLAVAKTFTEDDVKVAGMGLWNAIKSDVAGFVPTNVLAKAEHDAAQILLTPGPTTVGSAADLSRQLFGQLGWQDLLKSIHIGGPETSDQWHAEMRAASSLWGAGYRPGDLENELAREHSRGLAVSPPVFRGQSDWESRARELALPPQAPAAPQQVNVSGSATVDHTVDVHLHLDLDPALRATLS